MKGLALYVVSLIILFSILLPAQAFSDEGIEDRKILNIEVESRTGITAPEIVSITGIKAGEPYSTRKIRKGIELLFKKGIFSDIIVDATIIPLSPPLLEEIGD